MQSKATTPTEYIHELPDDRKEVITKLRDTILSNLPEGFEETMNYGMLGYVVPHSKYPDGYHCDPKLPLPFINIASQKNHIGFYHMGIYSDPNLLEWFTTEYPKYVSGKLDMGKSCIRFKNMKKIPFELLGELASKMTAEQWIERYESVVKK
ncbi:DUF1801 domain-containing protein [Ulvibacter litoralis]|uniref:YdhG-like domain-containing protein n=1 Tax=Ulvibacter litoralis TaxID=227084 RepID=A0A1G7GSA6_9FLAO|nr:DUF1801 domain-containing protein [Ulvibacter litoralis]GHC55250.1 hypothetical protein GCM10008083_19190 [Ulvibacter litoralis]SDE90981.1 protein of unknown function (DU1801) [Ulvibacter litoralis]